ncbi:MAG: monofunctional biosynthetic peptidoglycan transglycosylase [Acidobacteriota bacterium]
MRRVRRALRAAPAIVLSILGYYYLTLPDVRPLRNTNPSTTAFIELRASEAQARRVPARRAQVWLAYNRISDHLKRAVLVAEDSAFWQHEGVDLDQLQKSMEINWSQGRFTRGGSTITQQLAKNLYLSPSKNPLRKFRELLIARRLEAELNKRRILELYLNVIEWGDRIYGAEAASRAYFRRSASGLSAPQAALLAGAIINPRVHSPAHPDARLLGRQRLILQRMRYVEPPPPEPLPLPDIEPIPRPPGEVIPSEPSISPPKM